MINILASAAMAVRAEQKNINCEQKLQTQEQSFDHLLEGKEGRCIFLVDFSNKKSK